MCDACRSDWTQGRSEEDLRFCRPIDTKRLLDSGISFFEGVCAELAQQSQGSHGQGQGSRHGSHAGDDDKDNRQDQFWGCPHEDNEKAPESKQQVMSRTNFTMLYHRLAR